MAHADQRMVHRVSLRTTTYSCDEKYMSVSRTNTGPHCVQTTKWTGVMSDIISSKTKLLTATQRIRPSHHHATINKCFGRHFTYLAISLVFDAFATMSTGRTFFSIYAFANARSSALLFIHSDCIIKTECK